MRIGIITSGGDAPGMNATVRAVTRCALDRGIEVIGIHEGWQGVVDGGAKFEPFNWRSVGGILDWGLRAAEGRRSLWGPIVRGGSREAICDLTAQR